MYGVPHQFDDLRAYQSASSAHGSPVEFESRVATSSSITCHQMLKGHQIPMPTPISLRYDTQTSLVHQ